MSRSRALEVEPVKTTTTVSSAKRSNWAGDRFQVLKTLCPDLDARRGCTLLNSCAKSYGGQAIVEEALRRLKGCRGEDVWKKLKAICAEVVKENASDFGARPTRPGPAPVDERYSETEEDDEHATLDRRISGE